MQKPTLEQVDVLIVQSCCFITGLYQCNSIKKYNSISPWFRVARNACSKEDVKILCSARGLEAQLSEARGLTSFHSPQETILMVKFGDYIIKNKVHSVFSDK